MRETLFQLLPKMRSIRQQIHANPELAHHEQATAALICATLREYGLVPQRLADTGVVCVLDSGKPGKSVALRGDIDALPITETTGLSFQSKNPGVMHACGHDGHATALLAAACTLSQHKELFSGKIKFIFQPAEETGTGASALIQAGVLENPRVDAIFGWHNSPYSDAHSFKVKAGCMHASQDTFTVTIKGRGGHAAQPQKAIDPIYIATNVVQALQSIVSRNLSATDAAVVSVTQFNAGTSYNVIPDTAEFTGTIRTINAETQTQVKKRLAELVHGIVTSFGGDSNLEFSRYYPPTINHLRETELAYAAAQVVLPANQITYLTESSMACEDFSYYLHHVPGCFFWIGNGHRGAIHSSQYQFNDDILETAALVLMQVAISYLGSKPGAIGV